MKREEEQGKKMLEMENKLKEAREAVTYFNKQFNKKMADLENTKDVLEMQLKIQAMIGDGSDVGQSDREVKTKRGKKVSKKNTRAITINPTRDSMGTS